MCDGIFGFGIVSGVFFFLLCVFTIRIFGKLSVLFSIEDGADLLESFDFGNNFDGRNRM